MKPGIYRDISNEEYHKQREAGEHFYSSSQLKDILEDPEVFHAKYIAKTLERKSIPAFDIGTYFHTAILEPHLLDKECAVYTGSRRAGKKWEEFLEQHEGKAIITQSEAEKATNLIEAVRNSPIAMNLLSVGEPEISCLVELLVENGKIYCLPPSSSRGIGIYRLNRDTGWTLVTGKEAELKNPNTLKFKVRCDWHNSESGYIVDLKSSTGNVKNERTIKNKIASFVYDMSASMYLDLFNAALIANGKDPVYDKFYWVFASKDLANCKTWVADDKCVKVGRAKWMKAALLIDKFSPDWEFVDEVGTLSPPPWDDEWLTDEALNVESSRKFLNTNDHVKTDVAEFL